MSCRRPFRSRACLCTSQTPPACATAPTRSSRSASRVPGARSRARMRCSSCTTSPAPTQRTMPRTTPKSCVPCSASCLRPCRCSMSGTSRMRHPTRRRAVASCCRRAPGLASKTCGSACSNSLAGRPCPKGCTSRANATCRRWSAWRAILGSPPSISAVARRHWICSPKSSGLRRTRSTRSLASSVPTICLA